MSRNKWYKAVRLLIAFGIALGLLAKVVSPAEAAQGITYLGSFTVAECGARVTVTNNGSVHENTSVEFRSSLGTVTLNDVESVPGKVTVDELPASWAGEDVEVWVVPGPDNRHSLSWEDVGIECPPSYSLTPSVACEAGKVKLDSNVSGMLEWKGSDGETTYGPFSEHVEAGITKSIDWNLVTYGPHPTSVEGTFTPDDSSLKAISESASDTLICGAPANYNVSVRCNGGGTGHGEGESGDGWLRGWIQDGEGVRHEFDLAADQDFEFNTDYILYESESWPFSVDSPAGKKTGSFNIGPCAEQQQNTDAVVFCLNSGHAVVVVTNFGPGDSNVQVRWPEKYGGTDNFTVSAGSREVSKTSRKVTEEIEVEVVIDGKSKIHQVGPCAEGSTCPDGFVWQVGAILVDDPNLAAVISGDPELQAQVQAEILNGHLRPGLKPLPDTRVMWSLDNSPWHEEEGHYIDYGQDYTRRTKQKTKSPYDWNPGWTERFVYHEGTLIGNMDHGLKWWHSSTRPLEQVLQFSDDGVHNWYPTGDSWCGYRVGFIVVKPADQPNIPPPPPPPTVTMPFAGEHASGNAYTNQSPIGSVTFVDAEVTLDLYEALIGPDGKPIMASGAAVAYNGYTFVHELEFGELVKEGAEFEMLERGTESNWTIGGNEEQGYNTIINGENLNPNLVTCNQDHTAVENHELIGR